MAGAKSGRIKASGGELLMLLQTRRRLSRTGTFLALAAAAAMLAACGTPEPKAMVHKPKRSKEYFSEAEYGVKASPRVSLLKSGLPRGGGRDQLGRPYKVRGKWYHPREDRDYSKAGLASWYGDAFHGRLTANGEIYDMTHLTAAHPTMPLPSYARVTNTENGSSVIVRVNDRGPYHDGRIIDLSRRAAEMLDYTHSGTARVHVEYVGRAPLHGWDEQFLLASYRPGNRAPDPSDGLPDGVMIAMNGPTPVPGGGAPFPDAPFPGALSESVPLPALGPAVPERPGLDALPSEIVVALAAMSYAPEASSGSHEAFAALERAAGPAPYVAAGSYEDAAEAAAVAERLSTLGRVEVERGDEVGTQRHMVSLYPLPETSLDDLLRQVWASGVLDAFAVRP